MPAPALETRSLSFTYPEAARPAIHDVSFTADRGEIFGFLGPSGAGKSTTQNILIHLLDGYIGAVVGVTAVMVAMRLFNRRLAAG